MKNNKLKYRQSHNKTNDGLARFKHLWDDEKRIPIYEEFNYKYKEIVFCI